jgi:hypothetical protein
MQDKPARLRKHIAEDLKLDDAKSDWDRMMTQCRADRDRDEADQLDPESKPFEISGAPPSPSFGKSAVDSQELLEKKT